MKKIIKIFVITISTYNLLNQEIIFCQEFDQSKNLKLAEESYSKSDYKKAINYFLKAIENREGDYKRTCDRIGKSYTMLENYKDAIYWYKKGSNYPPGINGEMLIPYWRYSEILLKKNKIKEIIQLYKDGAKYGINAPAEYRFLEEGWFYLITSDRDDIYYNKEKIKRIGKNITRIWIKSYWDEQLTVEDEKASPTPFIYNESYEKSKKVEIYNEREQSRYNIALEEFDCENNKQRVLQITYFDKNGKPIKMYNFEKDYKNDKDGWDYLLPDSIGEIVLKKICKNK